MAKITLIGSGNTATTLGGALLAAGHEILQVWSRNAENAAKLAIILGCSHTTDLDQLNQESDLYLITVKDDAIEGVASKLSLPDKIVAHTSGVRSKDLLKTVTNNYGILYPNVSMTKGVSLELSKVLIMIEGSNENTISRLKRLADSISSNAKVVEERHRQSLHVAAVFANNFTNHLFVIAEQILSENGLSFDDIRPMIALHLNNLLLQSPSMLQTGPGVRRDHTAIDRHLELINSDKGLLKIYLMMTRSIQEWDKNKK
jgi:predicted short-subunit dehydrogenase-like oxidoreductase (DUF2520 family)